MCYYDFAQGMGDFLSELATMMDQTKPDVSSAALRIFIYILCCICCFLWNISFLKLANLCLAQMVVFRIVWLPRICSNSIIECEFDRKMGRRVLRIYKSYLKKCFKKISTHLEGEEAFKQLLLVLRLLPTHHLTMKVPAPTTRSVIPVRWILRSLRWRILMDLGLAFRHFV